MARPLAALAALGLVLGAARPARAQAADPDPWLGPDKALHFGASFALAVGGYGAGALAWKEPAPRLLLGGAVALAAGVGKELYDLSGHGQPSWRDLTWDVAGTAAGLGLALAFDLWLRWLEARAPSAAQVLFELGVQPPSARHWGCPPSSQAGAWPVAAGCG